MTRPMLPFCLFLPALILPLTAEGCPEYIGPRCVCLEERAHSKVLCENLPNLGHVLPILEESFPGGNKRYLWLYLKHLQIFYLPSRALGNRIAFSRFSLTDSNVRYIDEDAFGGQERSIRLVNLAQDRIQDIPTQALQKLTGLQTLGLAGNFLSRIREGALSQLPKLRFLALSDNRIAQIDSRDVFPEKLEVLSLSKNLLSTFNGSLSNLKNLEELRATDNRFRDITGELRGLVRLKSLYLDRNYLRDLDSSTFAGLSNTLTDLSLSGNHIRNVGKALAEFSSLKFLNLSSNKISELHWKTFENLKDLETLDLSGNYLKSVCRALRPLRALRELDLSDLGLRFLDPDCFRNFKYLSKLDLSHNGLQTAESVSGQALPALRELKLDHNSLVVIDDLRHAKGLRVLDISYNEIESIGIQLLSHNSQLIKLNMEGNPWLCANDMAVLLSNLDGDGVDIQGRPNCTDMQRPDTL